MDKYLWILVIGCAVFALIKILMRVAPVTNPYIKVPALFSKAELSFFGVLQQAVGEHYAIFGKVRVADVLNVTKMPSRKQWQRAFNPICAKHFDYVLCERGSSNIVAVIELNDKTHKQRDRRQRDQFLSRICAGAQLPMIQFDAAHAYPIQTIRQIILNACEPASPTLTR